jgi:DNA-3-methyladenine glycosylase II
MKKIVKSGPASSELADVPELSGPVHTVPAYWADACKHLVKKDRVMKRLIPKFGNSCLQSQDDAFSTLARSIVGQQISVKAAQTVWHRFVDLLPKSEASERSAGPPQASSAPSGGSAVREATSVGASERSAGPPQASSAPSGGSAVREATSVGAILSPAHVLRLKVDDMRAAGLSARKVEYLVDLSIHFDAGKVHVTDWQAMDDDAIIAELIAIRGIGRWTAEMFLIFYLTRPNVLPLDDVGLINGISQNYFSGESVSRSDAREVAAAWAPYCSVATWYIWRSLDPLPVLAV